MTDDQTGPEPTDEDLDDYLPSEVFAYPDDLLVTMVNLVNAGHMTLTIAVSLGGQTISGTLCGGAQYFERAAESYDRLKEAGDGNAGPGGLALLLRRVGSDYPIPVEEAETPVYFHMVDVMIGNNTAAVFRGRLSSVDGWTFGSH